MAHLLVEVRDHSECLVVSLDGQAEAFFLTVDPARPVYCSDCDEDAPTAAAYIYRHHDRQGRENWKLFVGAHVPVTVNGQAVCMDACVLQDHDEIRIAACSRLTFVAQVETHAPARQVIGSVIRT